MNFRPPLAFEWFTFLRATTLSRRMATTQDSSISDQLKALVRLQLLDSRIDQLKKLRGDLPDEIRDLEDEQAGLTTRIEKLKRELQESQVSRRQAEMDIKESEGLIIRYGEQQLQVRNNREYDSLTKEIEAQKQRIIDARARIEEIDLNIPAHNLTIEQAQARLVELVEMLEHKHKELNEVLSDTRQEQGDLENLRLEAENLVDARYLRAYKRLRGRIRDGRAVVPLERGAAGGYAVPPQRQLEIRQRNRIVTCEHTGRIIVDLDLYQEAAGEMTIPEAH
jgi:hypothetical protein